MIEEKNSVDELMESINRSFYFSKQQHYYRCPWHAVRCNRPQFFVNPHGSIYFIISLDCYIGIVYGMKIGIFGIS
ncbi:MAG: hypothetical protein ABIK15_10450 [Pseudomonadota bacterium]